MLTIERRATAPEPSRERLARSLERLTVAHALFLAALMGCAEVSFAAGGRMGAWMLPLAALVTVAGLRACGASWPEVRSTAALAGTLHVAAGLIAVTFPDNSWDGLAYHQEAVLRLAAGWNPLAESSAAYGRGNELYLDHYPNGSWTAAAAVLLTTGQLEAGKLFNLTLMMAAGAQVSATLLRLTSLPVAAAATVGVLAALNPVFIYQSLTFYVDNLVGSALTMLVAAVATFAAAARPQALVAALLAACIAINVKLTGLVYVAFLFAAAVPIVWWWQGRRGAWRMTATGAAAGFIGTCVIGYAPYVRNLVDHGDPLYPATPVHGLVDTKAQVPANLRDRNRVARFLLSNFSRSETVRNPGATQLKFPLWIEPIERHGLYGADIESGGFGPLYGAMLLVAGAGVLVLLAHPSARTSAGMAAVVAGSLAVSLFLHQEAWWARYAPQAWLLPLTLALPGLCCRRRSFQWCIGVSLVGLAVVDLSVVGANVAWRQTKYAIETRRALQEMTAAERVDVYLGTFRALRRRLDEAGVAFRMYDTLPAGEISPHPIPAPSGQAFWRESP